MGCCLCCCREPDTTLVIYSRVAGMIGKFTIVDDKKLIATIAATVIMCRRNLETSAAERARLTAKILGTVRIGVEEKLTLVESAKLDEYINAATAIVGQVVDGSSIPEKPKAEIAVKLNIAAGGDAVGVLTLIEMITYLCDEYATNRRGSAEEMAGKASNQLASVLSEKTLAAPLKSLSIGDYKDIINDTLRACL